MENNLFRLLYIVFFCNIIAFCAGCSDKDEMPSPIAVASLNVVNALPTSAPLIIAQSSLSSDVGRFYGIGPLSYASSVILTPGSGSESLYAIQKNADTTSINGQSTHSMIDTAVNFAAGSLYSLYITGTDTTEPDFLFVQDVLPTHTDSTVGIRFVNLSAGSGNVSVDIKGEPIGSEVSSLLYKGITDFKNYAAISTVSSYIFEFRDATTGTLLSSYTLTGVNTNSTTAANNVLFKNVTIALIGQPSGGTVSQSTMLIKSF